MKTLACVFLLSILGAPALAGTVTLPEPTIAQVNPAAAAAGCGFTATPNDVPTIYGRQAITGWSADGTHLYAATAASYPCGCRGRGCIRYYPWCGTLTWTITFDANGNRNPIGPATYTPGNPLCSQSYYSWNTSATFYNALNYGTTVETVEDIYSPTYYFDVATLLTP